MKFKFKFNSKLIIPLVSLFASLMLVILGSKNKYCLSFGFIFLGASLELFMLYLSDKMEKELLNLAQEIDETEVDETILEEEKVYILQQLYKRQKNIIKKKKRTKALFSICGGAIILLGFFNMF